MRTATSAADRSAEAGFTLLEVLVVVAILGLTASIVGTALPNTRDRVLLSSAESAVEAVLVQAQAEARRLGEPRLVEFDLDGHRIRIDNSTGSTPLPDRVEITVISAREFGSSRRPVIAFLPDGTSSGGEVTLVSNTLRSTRRIDWMTGRVRDTRF